MATCGSARGQDIGPRQIHNQDNPLLVGVVEGSMDLAVIETNYLAHSVSFYYAVHPGAAQTSVVLSVRNDERDVKS